ncbi:MAG: dual specificity protein phosphatase family protein [Elusimicrobia bacterium]|nr:dual specificity protein phosphatase family protein [Elusimicrobiota bacterium]
MRFALKLSLCGLVFWWPALRLWSSGASVGAGAAALALAGCSLVFLGLAYALHAGGLPVARSVTASPLRAALWQAALAPWAVVAAFILLLCRLFTTEAAADEVVPGLWVGSAPLPGDAARLRARGIDAVLSLTAEFPEMAGLARGTWARVAMLDGAAPGVEDLSEAAAWAGARRAEGKKVLVHCAQGHGRSALVVAAVLLLEKRAATAELAWELVKRARPGAGLKPDQRAALEAYCRDLALPIKPTNSFR